MSYQVLARKWRPHFFEDVVGQKHVTQSLINALQQQRLHHAYLFTGTRGIGKTTLARIFAKCLNCETNITANPCGKCSACQEIDSGRFIDLIEVDAASRTKVEDTRELLDNVQYAPTRGRFKIYLIDEVHMLSGHSFNALLKTLEEPPEHVKFLLATTDPQKLPITVLSRCLQFNLKSLAPDIITSHLEKILKQEQLNYEIPAIEKIAQAADGSVRDSLSLLDQAIAYGNNNVTTENVNAMLGAIEDKHLFELLRALKAQDANKIMLIIKELAEQAADFNNVLTELISLLHKIALTQLVPEATTGNSNAETIDTLAKAFTPEDIQLYYQIAIIGRRDLPFAASLKSGFEMIMLRMLAFQPNTNRKKETTSKKTEIKHPSDNESSKTNPKATTNNWHEILPKLEISPATRALAAHCSMDELADDQIQLSLHQKHAPLLNNNHEQRLNEALSKFFNKPIKVNINIGELSTATPVEIKTKEDNAKLQQAKTTIATDPNVKKLMQSFNATVIPDSITHK